MKESLKQIPNEPLKKNNVICRFSSNSKTVEITEKELIGLILWATITLEKSNGGSYALTTINFIKNNYKIMPYSKKRFKNLVCGSRLKNEERINYPNLAKIYEMIGELAIKVKSYLNAP